MADDVRTLTCPSCGAPLKATQHDRRIQCQYCHATVDLPDNEEPPVVVTRIDFTPADFSPPRETPKRTGTFIALLIFMLGIVPIGIVLLIMGLNNANKAITPGVVIYSVVNRMLVRDEAAGTTADIIGIAYNSDETHRLVYLDFDQDPVVQWKTEGLGDESYRVRFLVDGEQVFLVDETHLSVLNRADGTVLWETSLSDQLPTACDTCLLVDEGRLYALTQIGTLHTFDRVMGQQLWSAGLTEIPDRLFLFNSGPGVIDNVDEVPTLIVFDKEGGQRLQNIQPVCPNRTFTSDPQEMSLYSEAWAGADRNTFFTAYGFWEPGCVDQWNVETGERVWQAEVSEELTRSAVLSVTDDKMMYLAIERAGLLWAVDLDNGEARQLAAEENYYLRPLFSQDGVLVVEAQRTRGSTRFEIWGLDRESGERKWQVIPTAEASLDLQSSSIMDADGGFTVQNIDGGMALVQVFDDPERLTFDLIDLQTGVTQSQASYGMPEETILTFEKIGWDGNTIWIYSDEIYAFNGESGLREIKWP